jgi:hypothetical protein
LHRAVDEKAGAIGAFDLPIAPEIEKDSGMAERPTVAIAGSNRLVNVDGFERAHMRLGSGVGAGPRLIVLRSMMIRFAAPQSTIPFREQLRACGIDENA